VPEFELIRRLQSRIGAPQGDFAEQLRLGIGDDAAVFDCPQGRQLVACTDSLVSGVHFPLNTSPAAIGHKALAVNLSDLAAMGADPAWFLLSLTLPEDDPSWVDAFADGIAALARDSGILLAGGDLTNGPLNVCVTALGFVEPGCALTRDGARAGDLVVVSGRPGAAALALEAVRRDPAVDPRERAALDYPQPRLRLGRVLRGLATACIDLSDGLLADLGHVLEQSGVGAVIELGDLPVPAGLQGRTERERWPLQLAGGDDYELCFTLPPGCKASFEGLAEGAGVELSVIGTITSSRDLVLREPGGGVFQAPRSGYEHFGGAGASA